MADECTDVTTIEELTICCSWVESGVPEEHLIKILPLKKSNAESIYSALVGKNIQLGRLIGMGFDGAATFSCDKIEVQRRLKELLPPALFVHCRCHVLQPAAMQAANATPGIKHGSSFIITQNVKSHYRRFRKYYIFLSTRWLAH